MAPYHGSTDCTAVEIDVAGWYRIEYTSDCTAATLNVRPIDRSHTIPLAIVRPKSLPLKVRHKAVKLSFLPKLDKICRKLGSPRSAIVLSFVKRPDRSTYGPPNHQSRSQIEYSKRKLFVQSLRKDLKCLSRK